MIHFHEKKSPLIKSTLWSEIDRSTYTVLVADMNSKYEVQKGFLLQKPVLTEDSCLRAIELWVKIFNKNFSDWNIVSNNFMQLYAQKWLEEQAINWSINSNSSQLLLEYTQVFSPFLVSEKNTLLLSEWLIQNPSSLIKWGAWYKLVEKFFSQIKKDKLVISSWVAGVLLGHSDEMTLNWDRSLVVDLGSQLTGLEAELLLLLSSKIDIHIVEPKSSLREQYSTTLWPYSLLKGESIYSHLLSASPRLPMEYRESVQFKRYSSALAEVKSLVGQLNKWLAEGVEPHKIAVLAPNIEGYWEALRPYMQVEGIPFSKPTLVRAHSFKQMTKWLTALRLKLDKVSKGDLESLLYDEESELSYEKFSNLFSNIYSEEDRQRLPGLLEKINLVENKHQEVTSKVFFLWCFENIGNEEKDDICHQLIQSCLKEVPNDYRLSWTDWLAFLESKSSKEEIVIDKPDSAGIIIDNIVNAGALDCHRIYILGLTDENIQKRTLAQVSQNEVTQISQDLAITTWCPEASPVEFELQSLMQLHNVPTVLSTSSKNFQGKDTMPSLFWLQNSGAHHSDELNTTNECYWDYRQKDGVEFLVNSSGNPDCISRVDMDKGILPLPAIKVPNDMSLSATQLEKYHQCPFIFTSEKLFGLSQLPDIDLDIDSMTRGRVMHKVLEEMSKHDLTKKPDEKVVINTIQSCLNMLKKSYASPIAIKGEFSKLKKIAMDFWAFEREWLSQFPQSKIIARELKLNSYWSPLEQRFVSSSESNAEVLFKGVIDRIDGAPGGEYMVVDYKSSMGSVANSGSWLENGKFQLGIYMQMLEALKKEGLSQCVGGVYYVPKEQNRDRGFRLDSGIGFFYEKKPRERSILSAAQGEEFLSQFTQVIGQTMNQLLAGEISPRPKDREKNCPTCSWRGLCRAPHLI